MRRLVGAYFFAITGFLACPCHLPLTLPILIALFGGTALGGWLAANSGLVIGLSSGYFFAALVVGFWLWSKRGNAVCQRSGDQASACR